MNAKRVRSGKTGRMGWNYRFTSPVTKLRTHKTIWMSDRRISDKAFQEFLDGLEARRVGLPTCSGWELSYSELVRRFLLEAPISSDTRRKRLKTVLELNQLRLQIGADFTQKANLTAQCLRVRKNHGEEYVRKCVQQPLKQVSAWASSVDLFPHDPLAGWKRLPRTSDAVPKKAWTPEEFRAFVKAADDLDQYLNRKVPMAIVFKALLITGNRPTALFNATVDSLESDRICLPPGCGKKRNGRATIPSEFEVEIRAYLEERGKPKSDERLFVSPTGKPIEVRNIQNTYAQIVTLAAVRLEWPSSEIIDFDKQIAVADALRRKAVAIDGVRPKTPKKIAARDAKLQELQRLVELVKPAVERRLANRPLYSFRKTHRMWASHFVNADCYRLQCGWSAKDVSDRNYLDPLLVDASLSSQVVWDVLIGTKQLLGKAPQRVISAVDSRTGNSKVDLKTDLVEKNANAAEDSAS